MRESFSRRKYYLYDGILYRPCYTSCRYCYGSGTAINNKCLECESWYGYYPSSDIPSKCYKTSNPPNHYVYTAVLYDKRSFLLLFYNYLIDGHMSVNVIMKPSILGPLWIRIVYLFFNLNIIFALNAIFFSDNYIDSRASMPQNERVI